MKTRFVCIAPLLLAALAATQPAASQNQDEKQRNRRDIIARYIAATNQVTEMLTAIKARNADDDVRQRLENSIGSLAQIKTALKSDKLENSPQVQEMLKEKHQEIQQCSGKLAGEISRIRALPDVNPALLEVLNKI